MSSRRSKSRPLRVFRYAREDPKSLRCNLPDEARGAFCFVDQSEPSLRTKHTCSSCNAVGNCPRFSYHRHADPVCKTEPRPWIDDVRITQLTNLNVLFAVSGCGNRSIRKIEIVVWRFISSFKRRDTYDPSTRSRRRPADDDISAGGHSSGSDTIPLQYRYRFIGRITL